MQDFPGGSDIKQSTCHYRRYRRCLFNPWVRKIPWRRKWQPTPELFPGKSNGQSAWQATKSQIWLTHSHLILIRSACVLSHVWLFVTPLTVAHQAPQSMGFFQAWILEWVAISFSRGSFWLRDQTWVSHIAGRSFYCLSHSGSPDREEGDTSRRGSWNPDWKS